MARDFSPITFFQHTPNGLLRRYFHERHGVLKEINFDELAESGSAAEVVLQAFTQLTDKTQEETEAEYQGIESMAHQGGATALIEEATDFHQDAGFPEAISEFNSFHGKVMWVFLEHPNYWAGATAILHAENIPDAFWKRRHDVLHVPPHVEPEDVERLAGTLSDYFCSKEGRGRHCGVTSSESVGGNIFSPT